MSREGKKITTGSFFRILMTALTPTAIYGNSTGVRLIKRGSNYAVYRVSEAFPNRIAHVSCYTVIISHDQIRVVTETGSERLSEAAIREGIAPARMQDRVKRMIKVKEELAA